MATTCVAIAKLVWNCRRKAQCPTRSFGTKKTAKLQKKWSENRVLLATPYVAFTVDITRIRKRGCNEIRRAPPQQFHFRLGYDLHQYSHGH